MSQKHPIGGFDELESLQKIENLNNVNEPYNDIFVMYAQTCEKQQEIINRLQSTRSTDQSSKKTKHEIYKKTAMSISYAHDIDEETPDSNYSCVTPYPQHKKFIDGDLAIAQEQIDNLQRKLDLQSHIVVDCQHKNDELKKQMQLLEKELLITQEQLINQKQTNANLNEIIDNNALSIIQLNQDKQNLALQKHQIDQEKNNLMERYLEEKNNMAMQMNQINQLEEEMRLKIKILGDKESYFENRKNQTIKEMEKKGMELQTIMPKGTVVSRTEVPTKLVRKLLKHHQSEIYQIQQNTNGTSVATCGGDKLIKLYDPLNQVNIGQFEAHKSDQIYISLAYAPYTDMILAGTTDKEVQVLNYSTYKTSHTLLGHANKVDSVSFTNEKEKVISASSDRTIRIWDLNKGQLTQTINTGSYCRCMSTYMSEPVFATGHNDGSIRVYSSKSDTQKEMQHIKNVFDSGVTSLSISTNGLYMIATSQDGTAVKLIDTRKQNKVVKTFEHQDYYNSHEQNTCCYGPNDEYVIAGGQGGIFIWNIQTGKIKQQITNTGHEGVLIGVNYHNVTEQLFSSDSRGNLMIWC